MLCRVPVVNAYGDVEMINLDPKELAHILGNGVADENMDDILPPEFWENEARLAREEREAIARQHNYDDTYDPSTYSNDTPKPKRRTKPVQKRGEFEVIHFIIALVLVVVIAFAISAAQTKARCEKSPDFVACLTQDVSR